MTLDERLGALTRTAESMAQMRLDDERRYEEHFSRALSTIERLAGMVESHERRLDGLENR